MNKKQLVDTMSAKHANITKAEMNSIINDLIDTIITEVKNDNEVTLYGLGIFKSSLQKGKSGKVPGSDKTYTTQDKMVPRFKAAKAFKDAVVGN